MLLKMKKSVITMLVFLLLLFASCESPTTNSSDDGNGSTTDGTGIPTNPVSSSTNADLCSLTINSGTLDPVFSATTTAYSVSVVNTVSSVTVTGTKADENASVTAPVTITNLVAGVPQTAVITVTAQSGVTKSYSVEITRSVDYVSSLIGTLKYIPAGSFQRDLTARNISIVSKFRMSEKEITRTQYATVMVKDPSNATYSCGTTDPVQNVNWYHAITFCNKLSLSEGFTPVYSVTVAGSQIDWNSLVYADIPTSDNVDWNAAVASWTNNGYRLPTEMEWMWAAMGADTSSPGNVNITGYKKAFAGSTGTNKIGDYAWNPSNGSNKSHPVGTLLANELGIYDLSGNISEMCWDKSGELPSGTLTDFHGSTGTYHIARGGSWYYYASSQCSVIYRTSYPPSYQGPDVGFRVARN